LYRKDLWDEIGMKPDTWDDLRKGGAKLKAKGHPVGIGMAHHQDANTSWRSVLWSFGGAVQDKSGTKVTLNSKETLEAIKYSVALYKEAMTSEALSSHDSTSLVIASLYRATLYLIASRVSLELSVTFVPDLSCTAPPKDQSTLRQLVFAS